MCGILGWVSAEDSKISNKIYKDGISRLLKISEIRGKEASGICLLGNEYIKVYKQCMSASHLVKTPEYSEIMTEYFKEQEGHYRCCVGHARMVTNGDSDKAYNNQPVIADDLVCVHNGIIVNDSELWEKHAEIQREYEVDTEILLKLVSEACNNQNMELYAGLADAMKEIEGSVSIALLSAWQDSVVLYTNIGSLYYVCSEDGKEIIFASERYILGTFLKKMQKELGISEKQIHQLSPCMGININFLKFSWNKFDTRKPIQKKTTAVRGAVRKIIDIFTGKQEMPQHIKSRSVAELEKILEVEEGKIKRLRRCTRCLLPETFPGISYDVQGVCSVCHAYQPIQIAGEAKMKEELKKTKSANEHDYDALVLLSGGRDSCYTIHYLVKELGMKVVAYTYDWGMVTDLARRNIQRMCSKLEVEHILISANIARKRQNIRKNVEAWLNNPSLGTVPLFMAGDKEFFYHAHQLKQQMKISNIVLGINPLEMTLFKSAFANASSKAKNASGGHYRIGLAQQMNMWLYYMKEVVKNPKYINSSVLDTMWGYFSYYIMPHDQHIELFRYIPWQEDIINKTLIGEYNWETAKDTKDTWRIGDGTAAFYNYIYYRLAGFTEFDTFRSNQIREGLLTREQGLETLLESNRPRAASFQWYCDTIGIDAVKAARAINAVPTLYDRKK